MFEIFRNNIFSERLKTLRQNSNKTLDQVAKDLSIVKQTLSNYENGNRAPSLEAAIIISDYFYVSLDFLVGRTDDPRTEEFVSKARAEILSQICAMEDLDKAENLYETWQIAATSPTEEQIKMLNWIKFRLSTPADSDWTQNPAAKAISKGFEKFARTVSPAFLWPAETVEQIDLVILGKKVQYHFGFWIVKSEEELRPAKRRKFLVLEDAPENPGYLSQLFFSKERDHDAFFKLIYEINHLLHSSSGSKRDKDSPCKVIVKSENEFKEFVQKSGIVLLQKCDDADRIADWASAQGLHIAGIDTDLPRT